MRNSRERKERESVGWLGEKIENRISRQIGLPHARLTSSVYNRRRTQTLRVYVAVRVKCARRVRVVIGTIRRACSQQQQPQTFLSHFSLSASSFRPPLTFFLATASLRRQLSYEIKSFTFHVPQVPDSSSFVSLAKGQQEKSDFFSLIIKVLSPIS